jgi:hypothetical protein
MRRRKRPPIDFDAVLFAVVMVALALFFLFFVYGVFVKGWWL